jgi:hypothetical protein
MMRLLLTILSLSLIFVACWRILSPVQDIEPQILQAQQASAFLDSLGVNIHAGWVKDNPNLFARQLAYIGFHHVRDSINGAKSGDYAARLEVFARQGVDWDLIITGDPTPYTAWMLQNSRYLTYFEGPNEPDLTLLIFNGQQGVSAAMAIQQATTDIIHAMPQLHHLQLVDYALAYSHLYTLPPNNITTADFRNLHVYAPNGLPPRAVLGRAVAYIGPGKPVFMTETGYTNVQYNSISANGFHEGVDETVQAKYLVDTVLDNFSFGVPRTYLYDLRDDGKDPENTNKEYHYGLFRHDMSAKPSASAFHNLVQILNAPSAGSNPAPIQVAVGTSGSGGQVYSLLLQSPGGYALLLWAEPKLWSVTCHCAIHADATAAKIDFANETVFTSLYDPLIGDRPLSSETVKNSMIIKLVDHPIILRLQLKNPA